MNNEEFVYLLLQEVYLNKMGYVNYTEEEILKDSNHLFPEGWFTNYNFKNRINLIAKAIKENRSLTEVIDDNSIENMRNNNIVY